MRVPLSRDVIPDIAFAHPGHASCAPPSYAL